MIDDEYRGGRKVAKSQESSVKKDRRQGSNSRSAPNRVNNDNDFDSRDHNGGEFREEEKVPAEVTSRENGMPIKEDAERLDPELNPEK